MPPAIPAYIVPTASGIGGGVVLLVLAFVAYCCWRKRRMQQQAAVTEHLENVGSLQLVDKSGGRVSSGRLGAAAMSGGL